MNGALSLPKVKQEPSFPCANTLFVLGQELGNPVGFDHANITIEVA